MACPPPEILRRMLDDDLHGPEGAAVEAHVTSCRACQETLERFTRPDTEAAETLWTGPGSGLATPDLGGETRAGMTPGSGKPPVQEHGHLPDVPGYVIDRELGRGGMGVVYLARQIRIERLVAIKMVLAPGRRRVEDVLRFRIEGESLARLRHQNIVQVYDVGEHEGCPFLALEYVEGGNLASALAAGLPSPRQAAALVETLAHAVHAAHQAGILHRDLKPGNILLAREPGTKPGLSGTWETANPATPKITDFGLAKRIDDDSGLTHTGQILGTPSYMAPEQAVSGMSVGAPADVYALGAILYELLAGRPPFRGNSPLETLLPVVHEPAPPPSRWKPGIPRDLETICLKCLAKDPAARYASADALAEDLRRFLDARPIQARPAGAAERLWLWCRRRPALVALAAALVVAIAVGVVGVATQWRRAEANAARSRERLDLAMGVIERYHTGVSKDALLKQPELHELRSSLLKTPLEFYRRLRDDLERDAHPDPDARRRLAEASAALASLIGDIEPPEAAISAHVQALAAADALAADQPSDPAARRLSARLRVRLGMLDTGANRLDDAEKVLAAALERLGPPNEDPLDQDVRASALSALGEAAFAARKLDQAETHLTAAAEIRRAVAAARPDDPDTLDALADAERRLAIFQAEMRRTERVAPLFRSVLDIRERLARVRNDDESRFQLAKAYNNLGALCVNSDRTPEAEPLFRKALEILEPLVEARPSVAMYRSDLAVGHFNMGTFYDNSGRREEAEAAYTRALEIQRRLARDYDGSEVHQERFCRTAEELANIALSDKKYDQATAAYREVVAMRERMARRQPHHLVALADARRHEGNCEEKTGRSFAASASYLAALAEFDRAIADDSALPDDQWMRVDCLLDLARLELETEGPRRAGPYLERALAAIDPMTIAFPTVPKYRTSQAYGWLKKGDILADRGHRERGLSDEALTWYDRAAKTAEAILEKEPDDASARHVLADADAGRADVFARLGRRADALGSLAAAVKARPDPARGEMIELNRAVALARLGSYPDALKTLEALGEPRAADEDIAQTTAARVYALASATARADPALSPEARIGTAEALAKRSLDALARARTSRWIGDGARLARALKHRDFDALRERPEFQALAAEIAFPAYPFAR